MPMPMSMSIQAAVARIDQIMTWQQQLAAGQFSPTSSASATSTVAGSDPSQATQVTAGTSFSDALAAAQDTTGATGATATSTSAVPTAVQQMVSEADSLVGKPYVYGGGHSGWGPQSGYDCSGFVSAVLHAGGFLSSPQDTVTLPNQPGIESGPGQYVTIYDRPLSGQSGHVIIDINGQFYESGGEAGSWGGGGGVEKIGTPSASYLATFSDILHPQGL